MAEGDVFRLTDEDHRAIAGYMVEANERKTQQDQRDSEINDLLQERRERIESESKANEGKDDEDNKDKNDAGNGSGGGRQRNRPQPPAHFLDRPLSVFPGSK